VLFVIAVLLAIFVLPQPWGLVAVVVAGVIELAESALFLWWSQRRKSRVGVETLVGQTAIAVSALSPGGQVKVGGEIWGARSDTAISSGAEVVVREVDGLTLIVEPAAR
jgi:membrane protein implicated in regulation of membrane protease activity